MVDPVAGSTSGDMGIATGSDGTATVSKTTEGLSESQSVSEVVDRAETATGVKSTETSVASRDYSSC